MDINAMELKENVFNSSGQFTSHFCMATYLESAASGWCVWCLGTWSVPKPSLLDMQKKQIICPYLTREKQKARKSVIWAKSHGNVVFDSRIPK